MGQLEQFVSNHWALVAALLVLLLLVYLNEWFSQKRAPEFLSPQSVVKKMNHDNAIVFDLRDLESFSAGHIINSIRTAATDFDEPRMKKYKEKPIILVCQKGLQSQTLATKLKSSGFTNAMALAGGINAWQAAELPLVKGNK